MTMGVKVQQEQLEQFTVGQTTRQQVQAALGAPTGSTQRQDGTWQLQYRRLHTLSTPVSMRAKATTVTLEFDAQERLTGSTTKHEEENAGLSFLPGT
jgi:outer membrane protein assembly factor BamE (lipoprotein component of BamABCDE complex)